MMSKVALLVECHLPALTLCHVAAKTSQSPSSHPFSPPSRGLSSRQSSSSLSAQRPLPARFPRHTQPGVARCTAAGASGGGTIPPEDPYKVLGVTTSTPFDKVTIFHRKLTKEAERKGDTEAVERLERAYDSLMMRQLTLRRKGLVSGGAKQVSKDVRYADRWDYFPWRPRISPVARNEDYLNMAMAGSMAVWILITGAADYKPFQFLIAAFMFRVFLKLREATPPPTSSSYDEEEEGGERTTKRDQQNSKIILRTLGLVFGCIGIAALSYTVAVKAFLLVGSYPAFLASGQEKIITIVSAALLYYTASYLR